MVSAQDIILFSMFRGKGVGQEFGTEVKTQFGMAVAHNSNVSGFKANSSFLLMHTIRGSR